MGYRGGDPIYGLEMQPFWEGLKAKKLMMLRCAACGSWRWPWAGCREHPNEPYLSNMVWTEASGRGTIFTFSRPEIQFRDGFVPPYTYALVETAEGPLIPTNIIPHSAGIQVGVPVRVRFVDVEQRLTLPMFELVTDGKGDGH